MKPGERKIEPLSVSLSTNYLSGSPFHSFTPSRDFPLHSRLYMRVGEMGERVKLGAPFRHFTRILESTKWISSAGIERRSSTRRYRPERGGRHVPCCPVVCRFDAMLLGGHMQTKDFRKTRDLLGAAFLYAVLAFGFLAQQPECSQAEEPGVDSDARAAVVASGAAIPFDEVFKAVQSVPRFKDEYETSTAFEQRRSAALDSVQHLYLIEAPIDEEYVKYDADTQTLVVATYALSNTGLSSEEFSAMFGYGSELNKNGIEVEYSMLIGGGNIAWALPRERKNVGAYAGQNAFGGTQEVIKQVEISRGVFERQGAYEESIWSATRPQYDANNPPRAFEIPVPPMEARALREAGLRAAFLVAPAPPYYATGTTRFTPTLNAPYDRTTTIQYLIGDIQAVALFSAEGDLLAARATQ